MINSNTGINNKHTYNTWLKNTLEMEYKKEPKQIKEIGLSVIINATNLDLAIFIKQINSIINQDYNDWNLIIISKSTKELKKQLLIHKLNILTNTNVYFEESVQDALRKCKDYTLFIECLGVLEPCAFKVFAEEICNHNDTNMLYFDEDYYNEELDIYENPFFKPGWSPYLLLNMPYISNAVLIRTSLALTVCKEAKYIIVSIYDLSITTMDYLDYYGVYHISIPLFHLFNDIDKQNSLEIQNVKNSFLSRKGIKGCIEPVENYYLSNIVFYPFGNHLVSIIIPSKDHLEILSRCIDSVINKTSYTNYEIIVVDNGSNEINKKRIANMLQARSVKYIYNQMPFNYSKMCSIGVDESDGDYLCFLNDDIEIVQGDWLNRLVGQVQQKRIGAVGAKLYYPDSKLIQHAGMANSEIGVRHSFIKQNDNNVYCYGLNKMSYDCLSVTAACMVISRQIYESVGGFDLRLAVGYNDVDLCVKLIERGLYNIVRNDVILWHYESLSRGNDLATPKSKARLQNEQDFFYSKHPDLINGYDPFLNSNIKEYNDIIIYKFENEYNPMIIELLGFVRKFESIYIYGAGQFAKDCCEILNKFELNVTAFVVSELINNPHSYLGKPVILFRDFVSGRYKQNTVLILAMKKQFITEVVPKLKKEKIENYFVFEK